ncbi:PilZ domain-containing protein [Nitrospirota bacterium]
MDDKRQYKRFQLEGHDVRSKMHFTTEANLMDISLGGASISLNRRLNLGEEYNCRIKDGKKIFSIRGTVVWEDVDFNENGNGESEPEYRTGISFKKVLTNKGDNLAELIEDWAHTEKERYRVRGVRIKIKGNTDAELDHYGEYPVDEISFGGMRLETDIMIEQHAEFNIRMSIPNALKPIKVRARIASSRKIPESKPPRYKVGVEFLDMGVLDLTRIRDLIYSLD